MPQFFQRDAGVENVLHSMCEFSVDDDTFPQALRDETRSTGVIVNEILKHTQKKVGNFSPGVVTLVDVTVISLNLKTVAAEKLPLHSG